MKKTLILFSFLIFLTFNAFSLGKVLTPLEKKEYKAIKSQIVHHINAVGQHKATNEYIFQYLRNIGTPIALRYIEDNKKIDCLINEGSKLLINNKYHEAIHKFDEAICVDEDSWFIFPYRAQAYIGLNNLNEAINDFSRAIRIVPSMGHLYVGRAACYKLARENHLARIDLSIAGRLGDKTAKQLTGEITIVNENQKRELESSIENMFGFKPGTIIF